MADKKITTKQALILAGLKLFGEYGVPATSTRMISEAANANISAIKYYFESKEGLYHAVVEYIIGKIKEHNSGALESVMLEIQSPNLTKSRAKEIYKLLFMNIAEFLVGNKDSKDWAKIIMREQASPTQAFEIMYETHMKYIQMALLRLSIIIYGCSSENKAVRVKQHLVFGMILGFIVAQESFLRLMGEKEITNSSKELIMDQISKTIDTILNSPLG